MIIIREEPEVIDFQNPGRVFEMMADFVTSVDLRFLNEDQKLALLEILERIEEDEELDEAVKAERSTFLKKQYASDYYMSNKQRLKNKKEALKHSVEGKTRERMGPIMGKSGRTATGKKKLSYNT